jgi:A/G-specific adenine glycosylase
VASAIDYYHRFLQRFPDIQTLAEANEQEVLKLWQGLGYYCRARNIHYTAKDICSNYNGQFPNNYDDLLKLKGIGNYTAAAIAAFAFGRSEVAVDGNVYRVLARLFGVDTPIDTGAGKKQFTVLAREIMDSANPSDFNQAIIEFGALQCIPKNPNCQECPLQASCFAFENQSIDQYPVKSKDIRVRDRYFYYLFLHSNEEFLLERRTGKDIWTNLFQYPLIEAPKALDPQIIMQSGEWSQITEGRTLNLQQISDPILHKLSHQNLHIVFFTIELSSEDLHKLQNYTIIHKKNLREYPLPKPIELHLQEVFSIK